MRKRCPITTGTVPKSFSNRCFIGPCASVLARTVVLAHGLVSLLYRLMRLHRALGALRLGGSLRRGLGVIRQSGGTRGRNLGALLLEIHHVAPQGFGHPL